MSRAFGIAAVVGLLIVGTVPSPPARAQGVVAYQPVIGVIPDGQFLPVTPVVSADRRYVRLNASPQFITFQAFETFSTVGAVGGGTPGNGGGGGGGLGGLGGLGGGGAVGRGAMAVPVNPAPGMDLLQNAGSPARPLVSAQPQAPRRRPARALRVHAPAAPLASADPNAKAEALLRQGRALERSGQAAGALVYFRRVVDDYPDTSLALAAAQRIEALERSRTPTRGR